MDKVETQAVKSMSWLASFKFISQVFSWVATIAVARMLVPDDYGLMAMSTIITGYAEIFSELGLGAAIIQRPKITKAETSSVFWFSLGIACLFSAFCFIAAPTTAHIFNEPRIIPLTQAVSILFLLSGLQIVPLNLLKKELLFKEIGLIEMTTTIISCLGMLLIAYFGGGVWTLIGGRIIRGTLRVVLIYAYIDWRPSQHFKLSEALSFFRFGIIVAVGQSLFYMFEKSDRFFAGKVWSTSILGHYIFALQLAQIPTEKIVSLINQVSFTTFSKLQTDKYRFRNFYLHIVKLTSALVLPVFVGGFLLAEELVSFLLDDKWLSIVFLFKILCLVQIFTALNAVNNFVHTAKGNPRFGVYINLLLAVTMSISYFIAVQYEPDFILVPWVTTYIFICIFWIYFTAKRVGISTFEYLRNIFHPIAATVIMTVVVFISQLTQRRFVPIGCDNVLLEPLVILFLISMGGISYIGYYLLFDRKLIESIKLLRKK